MKKIKIVRQIEELVPAFDYARYDSYMRSLHVGIEMNYDIVCRVHQLEREAAAIAAAEAKRCAEERALEDRISMLLWGRPAHLGEDDYLYMCMNERDAERAREEAAIARAMEQEAAEHDAWAAYVSLAKFGPPCYVDEPDEGDVEEAAQAYAELMEFGPLEIAVAPAIEEQKRMIAKLPVEIARKIKELRGPITAVPADKFGVIAFTSDALTVVSSIDKINAQTAKFNAQLDKYELDVAVQWAKLYAAGGDKDEQNKKIGQFIDRVLAVLEKDEDKYIASVNKFHAQAGALAVLDAHQKVNLLNNSILWEIVGGIPGQINDQICIIDFSDREDYDENKAGAKLLKEVILNGFEMNGRHYIKYAASAGSTREKKMVAICEAVYEAHKDELLGGLAELEAQAICMGGKPISSPGKYENYKALTLSSVEQEFPIDWTKVLLVDEFTYNIPAQQVQFVDIQKQQYNNVLRDVEIKPDDGCFFINANIGLPSATYRGFWLKGYGIATHFEQWFGRSVKCSDGKVREITEETQAIINTSVLKMHKAYHEDMGEYATKVPAKIWLCKPEKEETDGVFNYQMLQTLFGTEEDAVELADAQSMIIRDLKQDAEARLDYLTKGDSVMAKLCRKYPQIAGTELAEDVVERKCKNVRKNTYKGKLALTESYRFLAPDPVFVINHYCGIEGGAIPAGQFVAKGYSGVCDILRAPHMTAAEHCLREAVDIELPVEETNTIFMSCEDINTIILNNDYDGDIALVLRADNRIVEVAKKNQMLPLVYDILTAKKLACDMDNTVDFYRRSYMKQKGVGGFANDVTKIMANTEISIEERRRLAAIGVQAANNEIDSAKTQSHYLPTGGMKKEFNTAAKCGFPWFMTVTKDKAEDQCQAKPAEYNAQATLMDNVIAAFDAQCERIYGNDFVADEVEFDLYDVPELDEAAGKEVLRLYAYLQNISRKVPKYWKNPPAPELFGVFKQTNYNLMQPDKGQLDLARKAFDQIASREQVVNVLVRHYGLSKEAGLLVMLFGNMLKVKVSNDVATGKGYIWDATDNVLYASGKKCQAALGLSNKVSRYTGLTGTGKKSKANGHMLFNLKDFAGLVDADVLAHPTRELANELIAIMRKG